MSLFLPEKYLDFFLTFIAFIIFIFVILLLLTFIVFFLNIDFFLLE